MIQDAIKALACLSILAVASVNAWARGPRLLQQSLRGYGPDNAHRTGNGETPLMRVTPWTPDEVRRAFKNYGSPNGE